MKADLVIPEVIAGLVETNLGNNISLLPFAVQDNTLVGKPGDTLKFPAFAYIGKANVVGENQLVVVGKLSASTVQATVKKFAKGVAITDEARLSGYGDPMGEAARQLAHSIDHAVDDELWNALNAVGVARKYVSTPLSADTIADALVLFGEDLGGPLALLTNPAGFALLRKDANYILASDLGQRMITSGVLGEIWGAQIIVTNKVTTDLTQQEASFFLVKPGALRIINKRGTLIEVKREPEYMRDNIFASKHCVAYLYDASKVVAITQFTGIQAVVAATAGIVSEVGVTSVNDTFIVIPEAQEAPAGYKWVYLLDSSAANIGVWDTALTGTTDWTSSETEIAASTHTKAHVVLVATATSKPVKSTTIDIVKKLA
jgi:hypothetical protein